MRENSSMTADEDKLRELGAIADAAQKAGDREAVIEALACIAALRPTDAHAHGALAMALSAAGKHASAITSFRNALAIDPNNAPGHFALGHALKFEGRFDEALAAYRDRKSTRLNSSHM